MPSDVALVPIYVTVKALLAAHAPLTALIGTKTIGGAPAIYDEGGVPQSATSTAGWLPYVTVGAGTQIGAHTFVAQSAARWGWNTTFQVKVVGQIAEAAGLAILSAVAAVLAQGRTLTVTGYPSAYVDDFSVQPTLTELVSGVQTRSWPAIVRVLVHD
jgi:hypothetical protein